MQFLHFLQSCASKANRYGSNANLPGFNRRGKGYVQSYDNVRERDSRIGMGILVFW